MTTDVVLKLDEFGRHALESFVRQRRRSHSVAVRTASLYYLADREAERPTWPVPRFAAERKPPESDTLTVTIKLDQETWRVVVQEAERQQVSAEGLVEHAVLYFLADLDSGRVAGRLDEMVRRAPR